MAHCEENVAHTQVSPPRVKGASNVAFVSFQGPILRERPLPLKAPQGFPPRPPPPFSLRPKEPRLHDDETGEPESPVDLAAAAAAAEKKNAKEEMYMLPSNIRQSGVAAERPTNYKLRLQVNCTLF